MGFRPLAGETLSNVLAVVSDAKLPEARVLSFSDYHANHPLPKEGISLGRLTRDVNSGNKEMDAVLYGNMFGDYWEKSSEANKASSHRYFLWNEYKSLGGDPLKVPFEKFDVWKYMLRRGEDYKNLPK